MVIPGISDRERGIVAELQRVQYPRVHAFVQGAPKVELHSHLGGSVTASDAYNMLRDSSGVMRYVGQDHSHEFHSIAELDEFQRRKVGSLAEYLDKHHATRDVFNDINNIGHLVDSMVARYAAENTRILEIRTALKTLDAFSGSTKLPTYSVEEEMMAYKEAIEAAREEYGMIINMILCIRRGDTDEHRKAAEQTLAVAREGRQSGFVRAIDLAGQEGGNHASFFREIFREAKLSDLNTTSHSGEAVHEGSIKQAVKDCWVDRIGHGTSLRRGSTTFGFVRSHPKHYLRRIPLEACLTSNVDCGAQVAVSPSETRTITSLDDHPLQQFYDDGLMLTVNCDNIVVSNTSLTNELMLLHTHFGFSIGGIARIIRNGINASFTSTRQQNDIHRELDSWMDQCKVDSRAGKG